jgi:ABC-type phosphate transport system substrate-binding protein
MLNRLLIICFAYLFSCQQWVLAADNGPLFIVGSTSATPLMEASSEAFGQFINQEDDLNPALVIRPLGSTKGVESIVDNDSDIGITSRYLTREELDQWPHLRQITIAQDALVFLVNTENPIDDLSHQDISDIYVGSKKLWSDLGAPEGQLDKIRPMAKSIGHGTFHAFTSLFDLEYMIEANSGFLYLKKAGVNQLFNQRPVRTFTRFNQAMGVVNRQKSSIAFESFAVMQQYSKHRGIEKVKAIAVDGVFPSIKAVREQNYPWVRPVNLIINSKRKNKKIDRYVEFMLSKAGQKIIKQQGYIPLSRQ